MRNGYIITIAEYAASIIELIGIGIILTFAIWTISRSLIQWFKHTDRDRIFQEQRLFLGRGILLGLEFLIAADIIHTVAIELTLESIMVLALIILIRTFLSIALEVELSGKWPWQIAKRP
ncbi:MAG: DUF1622 domain-containing protein [Methylophaga sp.]|nr:DUF1622 domain-containing protein [Methylophaga sp.]